MKYHKDMDAVSIDKTSSKGGQSIFSLKLQLVCRPLMFCLSIKLAVYWTTNKKEPRQNLAMSSVILNSGGLRIPYAGSNIACTVYSRTVQGRNLTGKPFWGCYSLYLLFL